MPAVSARYLDLARSPRRHLDAMFAAGSPPDVTALTGHEFRGYNRPRAAAALGIRKFIKVFYLDRAGRPFGCNTPVAQNGLDSEWLARPSEDSPRRYAFFLVEPADPDAADENRRGAVLLDYGRGGNRRYDVARILRDYLVQVFPGSDDLLLGKAYFVVAGRRLVSSYFLIERYRPLPDAAALAARVQLSPITLPTPRITTAAGVAFQQAWAGPSSLVVRFGSKQMVVGCFLPNVGYLNVPLKGMSAKF